MKTIINFLENNGEIKVDIGALALSFNPCFGYIVMCVNDTVYYEIEVSDVLAAQNQIQDILYDDYQTEIRFCEECGKPYDKGFMAGDGDWYCCEECFDSVMNETYGKGKWRPTDEEGSEGGYYEYFDYDEWEDTGIFYTEWN